MKHIIIQTILIAAATRIKLLKLYLIGDESLFFNKNRKFLFLDKNGITPHIINAITGIENNILELPFSSTL